MGCFGPDAPEPRNYGQETRDTLQAQIDLAPQLYRAEASPAYGQPAYSALALQNLNTILGGVPGGSRVESYQETLPAGWYDAQGNAMPPGWYEQQLNAPTEYWKRAGYDARGGDGTHEIQWMPERQVTRQRTVPTTGAPGLLDLLRQANTSQRAGDIADVAAFAPAAREAILAANPDTAALLAGLNAQAREDLASGSQLSPAQIRQMQQASRAAFAARGLADSNISVADELFRQLDLGRQLKAERQMAALRILGANQTIVGDPWMQILGRPSAAVPLGQGQFGLTGPGLFNPESAYAGNLYNSNLQMESQFAMAQPSVMSMIGSGLSMGARPSAA